VRLISVMIVSWLFLHELWKRGWEFEGYVKCIGYAAAAAAGHPNDSTQPDLQGYMEVVRFLCNDVQLVD
jgi:hypothetical protein